MALRNLQVDYGAVSVAAVLGLIKDAMLSAGAFSGAGMDFTQVEDSIAGSSFFVVQANQPSEPKSRMILQFIHAVVSTDDYIGVTVWESWSPGSPGSGTNPVMATDILNTPTTSPALRFHELDLTNGGRFYIDGDDVDGRGIAIHSDRGVTPGALVSPAQHYIGVCSIEKSVQPNYGVLAWVDAATPEFLSASEFAEHCFWIPPVNHLGNASNAFNPIVTTERAAYQCHAPVFEYSSTESISSMSGRGDKVDDYNSGEIIYPLFIRQLSGRIGLAAVRPVGSAFGFRGVLRGIFGYSRGAAIGFRSTIQDADTLQNFLAYPSTGVSNSITPYYVMPKA
jgi:hypothetical protein